MEKEWYCIKDKRVRLIERIGTICEKYECKFVEVVKR
jgi:hypothetical protein